MYIIKGKIVSDKPSKGLEESRGSQSKRRRMLEFTSESNAIHLGNEEPSTVSENYKVCIMLEQTNR